MEKKRSGSLGRFRDNKSQDAFDAINPLSEERLQEFQTAIEANSRTLVAPIFWLVVAAGLTASLITLTLVKAAFPFIKWIRQKILSGIRDAKFIQAFNAALQTTTQEEPEPVIKPTVKKKRARMERISKDKGARRTRVSGEVRRNFGASSPQKRTIPRVAGYSNDVAERSPGAAEGLTHFRRLDFFVLNFKGRVDAGNKHGDQIAKTFISLVQPRRIFSSSSASFVIAFFLLC